MSVIETLADVDNTFLSRRELTCNFAGLGGKLKKSEAVEMVSKEFKLDGRVIIPMRLKTHVGKPTVTGTFYVYEDEALAKKHVNPTIFSRLERAKAKLEEAEKESAEAADAEKSADEKPEEKPAESEKKAEEKPAEDAEKKSDAEKPADDKQEKAE